MASCYAKWFKSSEDTEDFCIQFFCLHCGFCSSLGQHGIIKLHRCEGHESKSESHFIYITFSVYDARYPRMKLALIYFMFDVNEIVHLITIEAALKQTSHEMKILTVVVV